MWPVTDPVIEVTPHECWVASRPEPGEAELAVLHPYDGTEIATVWAPGDRQVARAIEAATHHVPALAATRASALTVAADRLAERGEEAAEMLAMEAGTPLRWAAEEVAWSVSTLRAAAEQACDARGEVRYYDGRTVLVHTGPRGPVLHETSPYAPLATAALGMAPAIAVGAPVLVVPDQRTPLSALLLGEVLAAAQLPAGAFSVLPLDGDRPRLTVRSRPEGGCHAAVVGDDWDDLSAAAGRIAEAVARFTTRRVYVDKSIFDGFLPALAEAMGSLRPGSPLDPEVRVGPVADPAAGARCGEWVTAARGAGARLLVGGEPVSGAEVRPAMLVASAFDTAPPTGPLLAVSPVNSVDAAVSLAADASGVGMFTTDTGAVLRAADRLAATEVVAGDVAGPTEPRDVVLAAMRDYTREQRTVLPG